MYVYATFLLYEAIPSGIKKNQKNKPTKKPLSCLVLFIVYYL